MDMEGLATDNQIVCGLSLSASVVDFGELYYSSTVDLSKNVKQVIVHNESDSSYVVRYIPSSDLPLSLKVSTIVGDELQDDVVEFVLGPGEHRELLLRLFPLNDIASSQWGDRTSYRYVKISSKVCFKYKKLIDNADPDPTDMVDCPGVLLKYRASLCISVLHVDEHDFQFGSCVINMESIARTFQIRNQSENILQCKLQLADLMADGQQHREVASLDYFQFQDFETEALIRIQDDEIISIAPFASRQLRVLFHAQVRTTILVIVAATLSNPR
jgi:hypothetical protein